MKGMSCWINCLYQRSIEIRELAKNWFPCAKVKRHYLGQKIYLCSASAEDAIAFYKKLGCKAATERNEELFAEDPNDIQLELAV